MKFVKLCKEAITLSKTFNFEGNFNGYDVPLNRYNLPYKCFSLRNETNINIRVQTHRKAIYFKYETEELGKIEIRYSGRINRFRVRNKEGHYLLLFNKEGKITGGHWKNRIPVENIFEITEEKLFYWKLKELI